MFYIYLIDYEFFMIFFLIKLRKFYQHSGQQRFEIFRIFFNDKRNTQGRFKRSFSLKNSIIG